MPYDATDRRMQFDIEFIAKAFFRFVVVVDRLLKLCLGGGMKQVIHLRALARILANTSSPGMS